MVSEGTPPEPVTGVVKWFDAAKGFGFVVVDGMEADVLLHANALRNFGLSSVCDGARMRLTVQKTQRGYQTLEVLDVQPPEDAGHENTSDDARSVTIVDRSIPLEPGRVKWFDKVKGFGFANVFAKPDDVFIHMETLRRSGLAELQPGEAIALRVVEGDRGRMAVSIEAWEEGLRDGNRPVTEDALLDADASAKRAADERNRTDEGLK